MVFRPKLLIQYAIYTSTFVAGRFSERRAVQIAAASIAFVVQVIMVFDELGVLGSW